MQQPVQQRAPTGGESDRAAANVRALTCANRTVVHRGEPLERDWGSRGRRFRSCPPHSVTSQDIPDARTHDSWVRATAFSGVGRPIPRWRTGPWGWLIQLWETPWVRATSDCEDPARTAVMTGRRLDTAHGQARADADA